MPDWEKITEEPGATPAGTTRQEFAEGVGGAFKGVAKGLGRDVVGASQVFLPSGLQPPESVKSWAMSPGQSMAEKAGIGVGSAGPYMFAPELGLEGLAGRALSKAPGLVRAAGSSLGKVVQRGISGGIGGAMQPAESEKERIENADWGAKVGAGLAGLGVVGKGMAALPSSVKYALEHTLGLAVGSVLGEHFGHPFIGAYVGHRSHIGRLLTEALPKVLETVGKVRGAPAGAAAVEATEKNPPEWEKLPPGGGVAP